MKHGAGPLKAAALTTQDHQQDRWEEEIVGSFWQDSQTTPKRGDANVAELKSRIDRQAHGI
jgi:hypothetical protein